MFYKSNEFVDLVPEYEFKYFIEGDTLIAGQNCKKFYSFNKGNNSRTEYKMAHQASVRLTWNNQKKTWLLTAFEKKNSVLDNTTDTDETSTGGKQNDTATLQNTVSADKDTDISANVQENSEKHSMSQKGRFISFQGRKLQGKPARGIYIENGKKS